jgi:3-dehydroquinate synthase
MKTIQLDDYNIQIGDIWSTLNTFLKERNYSKIAVLVDDNTHQHCLPILEKNAPNFNFLIIKIAAGEQHKNLETCQKIWQRMMELGLNRNALTINLGGGVIGDMGGFCASTFKRGMDFLQMPTTLLSQVDASIGGKLGIDFMQVKNSIGLFKNPQAVLIAPEFLQTLPFDEIRSGFGEIIKHTLIDNAKQWANLQAITDLTKVDWPTYLAPSLQIKKRIVEVDPFEKGIRKALNFGHTIGHAIEGWALETEKPLLHGEAIAIGMICEAWLSHQVVGLPMTAVDEIVAFISRIYEFYPLNETAFPDFLHLMTKDKKNENEAINFTMIQPVGKAVINQTAAKELILKSLRFYNEIGE